jgi:hypothetical protein
LFLAAGEFEVRCKRRSARRATEVRCLDRRIDDRVIAVFTPQIGMGDAR